MDNTANTKRDLFPLLAAIALAGVAGALIGGFAYNVSECRMLTPQTAP